MFKYNCLNAISEAGLKSLSSDFVKTDDVNEAEAILVRSAAMHDMEFSDNLLAVARAGAGVNNIPLDKCAEKGIVLPPSLPHFASLLFQLLAMSFPVHRL